MRKKVLAVLMVMAMLVMVGSTIAAAKEQTTFIAHLTVAEGSCPNLDSNAHGVAIFHVNEDGTIRYKLIVNNIENVTAAHIHTGAPGVNGPVLREAYTEELHTRADAAQGIYNSYYAHMAVCCVR